MALLEIKTIHVLLLHCLNQHPAMITLFSQTLYPVHGLCHADLLSRMLRANVTVEQLLNWFPNPHNQGLVVHPDLQMLLSAKGIHQWPPHAYKLPHCSSYKLSSRAVKRCKRSEAGETGPICMCLLYMYHLHHSLHISAHRCFAMCILPAVCHSRSKVSPPR